MRVLSRDAAGALVFTAGRFVSVTSTEAAGQLLRERAALQQGDDPRYPLRGTDWAGLRRARATPAAAAAALAEDLIDDPLVRSVIASPVGEGYVTRAPIAGEARRAWALEVRVVLRDLGQVLLLPLEVPID